MRLCRDCWENALSYYPYCRNCLTKYGIKTRGDHAQESIDELNKNHREIMRKAGLEYIVDHMIAELQEVINEENKLDGEVLYNAIELK